MSTKCNWVSVLACLLAMTGTQVHAEINGNCGVIGTLDSNGLLGDRANGIGTLDGLLNETCVLPTTPVQRLYLFGSLFQENILTTPDQARIRIEAPDGQVVDVQPFTDTEFGNNSFIIMNALHVEMPSPVTTNGTWRVRLYETVDDGGTESVDASWADFRIEFSSSDGSAPNAINLGSIPAGLAGAPTTITRNDEFDLGEVVWYSFTVPADISDNSSTYFDISSVNSVVEEQFFTSNIMKLAVFDAQGNIVAQSDNVNTDQPGWMSFGEGARLADGYPFYGQNGALPSGTYYLCAGTRIHEFRDAFYAELFIPGILAFGTASIDITSAVHITGPAPAATNLGSVDACNGVHLNSTPIEPEEVIWYAFTLDEAASAANGTYLDIDLEDTVVSNPNTPFTPSNLALALYDATGNLVVLDTDDGSYLLPQASFGTGTRTSVGHTKRPSSASSPLSEPYNGRDGDLPAGMYYLAVTAEPAQDPFVAAQSDWVVASTHQATGQIWLNIRTNLPATPSQCCPPFVLQNPVNLVQAQAGVFADPIYIGEYVDGSAPLTVQWMKDGQLVTDDPPHITGSSTSLLIIDGVLASDAGDYTLHVTNDCGTTTSPVRTLTVLPPPCFADFNNDQTADFFDLLDFLDAWFASNISADINNDFTIDFFDLLDYLDLWFAGCP